MRVSWLGHSSVLVEADGVRVLADPLLRPRIGPLLRVVPVFDPGTVDAVVISHLHHDHCDLPSLRALRAPVVIAPPGSARWLAAHGVGGVRELAVGERLALSSSVGVVAVPADHSGRREPRGPSAPAVGHVVESTAAAAWLAGDTGLFQDVNSLATFSTRGVIDVAAIPVWGWGPNLGPGHLDPAGAAAAIELAGIKVAVPVHWGTLYPAGMKQLMRKRLRSPGPDFASLCPAAHLLRPGGSLAL